MKAFEYYAARERVDGIRRNAIRVDARRRERRLRRALTCLAAVLPASVLVTAIAASAAPAASAEAYADMETAVEDGRLPGDDIPATKPCCMLLDDTYDRPENDLIEAALLEKANMIEDCTITHYDCCVSCCGKTDGITASGVQATPGVTVAVDPDVIPLGSDVLVDYGDGEIHYYRADDIGGAVKGNHIDLCVESHEEALLLGCRTATVYWVED